MRPLARLLSAVAALVFSQISGAQELSPELLYQKVLPSVLTLKVETKSGDRYVGAAFLAIKENVAVTAWHVIHDAARVTGKFADGTSIDVEGFIDKDENKDIALIKVDGKKHPLAMICKVPPLVGARAYVIGSPKGYEFSISDGLFSQIQKVDGFDQYQVSCPFSPGNSGGPILNSRGEVLGVAAWTRNGAQNLNFATPATEAFELNPTLPLKRWKTQPGKRVAVSSETKRKSAPETDSTETAAQLKQLLQKSSGKQITVTVAQDGQQEKFTFKVPADFVK